MTRWWRADAGGVLLTLHVQPNAARTEVVGLHGEALKLRVAAPAVDDKANAELLAFLAERLGVRPAAVTLVQGRHARRKKVRVSAQIDPQRLLETP